MKNYYLLFRFGGSCVSGILVLNQSDPESARKKAIYDLIGIIKKLEKQYPNDEYQHVKRHKEFLKSLIKPWRKTTIFSRREPVLEIMELPIATIIAGYWLGLSDDREHLCNIPRERTQDSKYGYIVSSPTI